MTPTATLFHPFETGEIELPTKEQRTLFLGPEPGLRMPAGFAGELVLANGFRPSFMALRQAGFDVRPSAEGDGYDLVLVRVSRHRGQNELWVAEALRRSAVGALTVIAGGKEDGIASLRKRIDGLTPLEGSASKYHGVVFWLRRPGDANAIAAMLDHANAASLIDGRFRAAPGMFSHDRIDAASRLLAGHLPVDLTGAAADFCAGWGYLAAKLLERCPGIASVDLFEADHASLEAARENLADAAVPAGFHWTDLASEPMERRFDVIVMNPPFHQGRAADPGIGLAMIRAASSALRPNGRLFMVANRGLPYEQALAAGFKQSGELVRDGGFKVLWARR